MLKKFVSILMLCIALAFILGHNFIGHHHHDFELGDVSHLNNHGHHHENDSDSEDEGDDWCHLFSGILHGADGLTFLTSQNSNAKSLRQIPQPIAILGSNFIFRRVIIEVRQNPPPYIADYYNSRIFLRCGLRAPPISVV